MTSQHLQVDFQPCCIVKGNCRDEDTDIRKKVDNKDELHKFLRTPDGLKNLSNKKQSKCTNNHLEFAKNKRRNMKISKSSKTYAYKYYSIEQVLGENELHIPHILSVRRNQLLRDSTRKELSYDQSNSQQF